jgi:phage gpG-like protein
MSRVRVDGIREVRELLREMRARASDASAVWPKVGDHIAEQIGRQFDTEGAHFGTPWDPRKPDYGTRAELEPGWDPMSPDYGHGPLLVETGELRDSFTSRPMSAEHYSPQEAVFGSDDYRAPFHHDGTSDIPARPIVRATDDLAEDVSAILARYIAEGRVT